MNWDLVRVLAPPFVDDPRMELAMTLAGQEVSLTHCFREQVVVLLAAHKLEMGDRAGVGGSVASEREGALERTYHAANASDGLLAGTSYGLEVARLNRLCYGITAGTGWLREDLSSVI